MATLLRLINIGVSKAGHFSKPYYAATNSIFERLRNTFFQPPQLQYDLAGLDFEAKQDNNSGEKQSLLEQLFDGIWNAAPKSKITPGRKRIKHKRYFPDRVAWVSCKRCGEPKQPHRFCTTHIDICAMREEGKFPYCFYMF